MARRHEKVRNQRKDYLHKLSFRLAEEYDAVAVEDLNLKAMSRSLNFGKSVMDNGYGSFLNMLSYKLEERGKVTREDRPVLSLQQEVQQMREGERNTGIIRADLSLRLWKSYGQGCKRGD